MAMRRAPDSAPALVFAILGGQSLITILGMRSEFDRYHLPMALLGAIGAAAALSGGWKLAGAILARSAMFRQFASPPRRTRRPSGAGRASAPNRG
jgi:hypothetical protein